MQKRNSLNELNEFSGHRCMRVGQEPNGHILRVKEVFTFLLGLRSNMASSAKNDIPG